MKNFLKLWLNELRTIPAKAPLKKFSSDFPSASGTEWLAVDNGFEVRFSSEGNEMIAKYSTHQELLEFRKNLPVDSLSATLQSLAGKWGEVMSLISINKPPTVNYEIIFRKPDHTRFLIIVDENGDYIENPKQISATNYKDSLPSVN